MEETKPFSMMGTVVWLTPKDAQGNHTPGIGVQFQGEEGKMLQETIEAYLKC